MGVTTYKLYELLRQDQLSFIYGGAFDDAITGWVVDLSSLSAKQVAPMSKLKKKVSFLVVECLQNVVRHGNKKDVKEDTDFFMVRLYDNAYYITSSNLVPHKSTAFLEERLKDINSKSSEELKAFYLDVLQKERGDERGGGLGLIEMARKSGQKIEFSFEDFDDTYKQFIFRLRLSPEEAGGNKSSFQTPKDIIHAVKDQRIHMVYRGDFSEDAMEPVLNMIETSLTNEEGVEKGKKVFRTLVELFQNIRKHGQPSNKGTIEGILILGESKGKIRVSVANFMNATEKDLLVEKIDFLNSLDKAGKSNYFRELLKAEVIPDGAGFGLVEVARMSPEPLEYGFFPINDETSYFEITTLI